METLQGQFWTPRRLWRAWGHRQVKKVAERAATEGFAVVAGAGVLTVVEAIHVELTTGATEAERSITLEVLRHGITIFKSLIKSKLAKETTTALNLLTGAGAVPGLGATDAESVELPAFVLDPQDEVVLSVGEAKEGDSLKEIALETTVFEPGIDHDWDIIQARLTEAAEIAERMAAYAQHP